MRLFKRRPKGIVYMCGTDWEVEWPQGQDIHVYQTVERLKRYRKCWAECGIVAVEVTFNPKAHCIVEGRI